MRNGRKVASDSLTERIHREPTYDEEEEGK